MSVTLLCLEGDGIGPEIMAAAKAVVGAASQRFELDIKFNDAEIGFAALKRVGTTLPNAVLERAREVDGVIIGPVSHNAYPPVAEGGVNPSGRLRREMDLYANIRPAKSFDGAPRPLGKKIDLVIVRENTEGFYADRSMHVGPGEFMPDADTALALRKVTRRASRRILETGFRLAAARREKLTVVHKANVLRLSDGLFLEEARSLRAAYPGVAYEEQLVDAMAALLVRDAGRFDVIVTTNMFGDILSDQASEIAGGLGLAASLNAGSEHAAAQAQHGSAPDLAGQDRANPTSLIGSSAMLLRWIGERRSDEALVRAALAVDRAVAAAIDDPKTRTADLGGSAGTEDFTRAVVVHLEQL
ncbi:MAG: isocitrate/isopropylmalate family dehydrogenase [Alphaproteobacteria bacterium]|nr:isocitrate/isopropylmalate family dehydrogenase [Alphaproteobacteria bacterium]